MARPLVLVAWEPRSPEEALAVHETLSTVARVEWIHELSGPLAGELLPQTLVILVGRWPPTLTESLASMRSLRLVVCVEKEEPSIPVEALRRRGVQVEWGAAPGRPKGPVEPERHVEWARQAAERAARLIRSGPG